MAVESWRLFGYPKGNKNQANKIICICKVARVDRRIISVDKRIISVEM